MKNLIILTFITAILITGCGFKIVKQPQDLNFSISKIQIFGEKRINYNIKSQILNKINEKKEKSIILKITTNKDKIIKEKNIKNEITKYQIEIVAHIDSGERGSKLSRITISKKGEYTVNKQYSQTIRNEKKLVEVLAESLSKEVIFKLSERCFLGM